MQRAKLYMTGLSFSLCLLPAIAMAQISDDDSLLGAPAHSAAPQSPVPQNPVLAPETPAPALPPLPAIDPPADAAASPAASAPATSPATANGDTPLPDNPTADDDAQADAAYDMIFKKLTPKHQEQMKALDKSFVETLHPAMQVFRMGAELEYCLQPPHALAGQDKKYIAAFRDFRDQRDDEQDALWAAHRKETMKITFLDHELLDAHYRNQAALAMAAGRVLMQDEKAKTSLLSNTDCAATQKVLDSAAAKADAKGKAASPKIPPGTTPNIPATPSKPAPQGTQTPSAR